MKIKFDKANITMSISILIVCIILVAVSFIQFKTVEQVHETDIETMREEELREQIIEDELKTEIKDAVQTFNYQINTLQTCNGQAPFLSLCIYLNEDPEYSKEIAMLAEEFFRQRLEGMKNKFGIKSTQTFPKLLYFLDENNTYEGSEYFYLTKLAVECTSVRMNPDYISVKKMKQLIGYAFPCINNTCA